jgi:hypothetical protein
MIGWTPIQYKVPGGLGGRLRAHPGLDPILAPPGRRGRVYRLSPGRPGRHRFIHRLHYLISRLADRGSKIACIQPGGLLVVIGDEPAWVRLILVAAPDRDPDLFRYLYGRLSDPLRRRRSPDSRFLSSTTRKRLSTASWSTGERANPVLIEGCRTMTNPELPTAPLSGLHAVNSGPCPA